MRRTTRMRQPEPIGGRTINGECAPPPQQAIVQENPRDMKGLKLARPEAPQYYIM